MRFLSGNLLKRINRDVGYVCGEYPRQLSKEGMVNRINVTYMREASRELRTALVSACFVTALSD